MPLRLTSLPSSCAALVLLFALTPSALCRPNELLPRAGKTIVAPIAFTPAQNWEGIDGSWNTFALRTGSPEQQVRVLISTASQQTWVVDPRGCPDDTPTNNTCAESRGTTFNLETSKTWKSQGLYDLWIESNLGLTGNAEYGFDTVGLGYPGEGGLALEGQIVGALAVKDFYFGHFGINPKPTNFTNFTDQSPSFMTTLRRKNLIPSVSWGYTAGVPYRFAKVLSSLTLGGYDSSRFVPNGVSFPFAPDNERDILVSIQSIITDISGGSTALLPIPTYAYVDSTVAEIWLPVDACVLFEKAFGLTWDPVSELYLVTEGQHNQLILSNANITFNVVPYTQQSGQSTKQDNVNIVLPYKAFDLTAKPPYQGINKSSRYFPLRRAANDTQYTLGRTFLQEAYLTVDWERQNFSISQCKWLEGAASLLVPIESANGTSSSGTMGGVATPSNTSSKVSVGAIAGIVIAVVAILVLTGLWAFFHFRRKAERERRIKLAEEEAAAKKPGETESSKGDEEQSNTLVFPKAELEANTPVRHEADDGTYYKPGGKGGVSGTSSSAALVESDSKEREIFEMPGDMPARQEADGRQLSEKDVIRAREERYNGVDPALTPISPNTNNSASDRSPVSPNDRSPTDTLNGSTLPSTLSSFGRRALVQPSDVIELNQMVSPIDSSEGSHTMMFSPLSPITPSDNSPDATRRRFSYEE
ncbi:acid protease [Tothia fuscella]|uniref:Acid protease n=1 Tax=Tothia fuscella TaxID=1048955 RepID=A0A9P4NFR0_9PEZI|nr:acid protease [Tothia fuscella]